MLSGAMVIGLPLAPLTALERWSSSISAISVVRRANFCVILSGDRRALQALRRVLRTPEDRGVLVLGERRFLEKRVRSALPSWIQDEMIECDSAQFREVIAKWK